MCRVHVCIKNEQVFRLLVFVHRGKTCSDYLWQKDPLRL